MSNLKNIFLLLFFFTSCKKNIESKQAISNEVKDSLTIDTPKNAVKLTQFSEEFIVENKIDQWPDFIKFKESIEDLSKLNPKGVIIFLSELFKVTKKLLQSPFPKNFDGLPVYSRVKVVQTKIIKCHFYASNNQSKKLNKSLDELYLEYNILLKRMISFIEERQIPLDSTEGLIIIHDSKINPVLSNK